jgi:hypothetical protein
MNGSLARTGERSLRVFRTAHAAARPGLTLGRLADPPPAYGSDHMDTNTLILIVLVVLLLGGGGIFFNRRRV